MTFITFIHGVRANEIAQTVGLLKGKWVREQIGATDQAAGLG